MKVSLNWLTDYVDVSMPAEELGRLLTGLGMNCEEIIPTPTDVVFDLEITSNRPDELGYLGVARTPAGPTRLPDRGWVRRDTAQHHRRTGAGPAR